MLLQLMQLVLDSTVVVKVGTHNGILENLCDCLINAINASGQASVTQQISLTQLGLIRII